jgi:hypothetical protein
VRKSPNNSESDTSLPKVGGDCGVVLKTGEHFVQRVDAVRGTVDNPMTRGKVVDKCRDLIAPVLGSAKCDRLVDTVLHIEQVADLRSLRPVFQKNG